MKRKLTIIPKLGETVTISYLDAASGSRRRLFVTATNTLVEGEFEVVVGPTDTYVEVAVMGSRYTYRVPESLHVEKSDPVRVPFGATNTLQTGVVTAVDVPPPPTSYVKDIAAVAEAWVEA